MAKHVELNSIHLGAHFSETDPSLDPDNHVRTGMLWVDMAVGPPYVLKVRNIDNDGWDVATGGAGTGAMVWEGPWNSGTAYYINDVVEHEGSAYIAILDGTNHEPGVATTYWQLVAAKGADSSAPGPEGPPGADGADFAFVASTLVNEALSGSGATASASLSQEGANAPSYVIDNNSGSYYQSLNSSVSVIGEWVKVDLGSEKTISRFSLVQTTAFPATWKLQSSTDDSSWTDRWLGTGASVTDQDLAAPVAARYWRILGVTESASPGDWIMNTLALYSGSAGTGGVDQSYITMNFVIDGGGLEIADGVKGDMLIDFKAEILGVTLLADQTGSIVVDIWKDTYANFPPTDADSITASGPPTISSSNKAQASLAGWTTAVAAGSIFRFNVDSCTTITRCTVALSLRRVP